MKVNLAPYFAERLKFEANARFATCAFFLRYNLPEIEIIVRDGSAMGMSQRSRVIEEAGALGMNEHDQVVLR